jgi:MFS family permease
VSARLVHYAVGSVLVRLADEGARVALALLALDRTGSPAVGGALVAALLIPHVVAAPVIGMLADRSSRPRYLVAGAALGFAIGLAVAAVGLGRLPLALVVLALLAGGCCGAALTGALTSQLPDLVAAARLPRAFGLDSLTYNGAGIAGPAVAAIAAGATSPAAATFVLAGCATVGGAVIAVLPTPRRVSARARRSYVLAGVRLIRRDRVLSVVTAATSIGQLGLGALPVIAAVIAEHQHSSAVAGSLLTTFAAGGLVGSLVWTWRPARPEHATAVVMIGLAGVGLPLVVAAWTSSSVVIAALFALAGFSNGPLFGALLMTRNDRAPAQLRGQVFTLGAGFRITSTAAGAALGGVVASDLSVAALLVLAGGCSLLAAALGQVLLRRNAGGDAQPTQPAPRPSVAARPGRRASS